MKQDETCLLGGGGEGEKVKCACRLRSANRIGGVLAFSRVTARSWDTSPVNFSGEGGWLAETLLSDKNYVGNDLTFLLLKPLLKQNA